MIFTDSDELSRYLLYGTTDEQSSYTVKEGDTISDVAEANKLNVQEFLIANPQFSSENNLLYAGQEVVVGLIDPIINIEEVVQSVSDEVHKYTIETQYDETQLTTYEKTIQEGEDGLDRVTRKLQYINGQLVDSKNISSTELTPSVSKVIIKGSKVASYIADLSYWAWPTNQPYIISTYYGYRWGSMHPAIDITGAGGYNSPIYAANNGTVVAVGTGCIAGNISCNGQSGNYVVINHNIGNYYTKYMHMNNIYVKVGDTVERGTKIGTMGNTGWVVPTPTASNPYGGTHLHFAVSIGDPTTRGYTTIDPLTLYR
jgi:murein DD-endopeptidase MepM/ murein hydrolase activator NlpD